MRKTKYLDKQFGVWKCVKVNIHYVQPAFRKGTKIRSRRPYHQTYSYVVSTVLLGNELQVEISARQAARMYRGEYNPIMKVLANQSEAVIAIK